METDWRDIFCYRMFETLDPAETEKLQADYCMTTAL